MGDAYYPLHNITRVHTLVIHPRRWKAFVHFLQRVLITAVVWVALHSLNIGGYNDADESLEDALSISAMLVIVYSFGSMLDVIFSSARLVLAVDTSGSPSAVLAGQQPDQLRALSWQIAYAIEHPDVEFGTRVALYTISLSNYYLGDSVNVYGGTGNIGMVRS